MKYVLLIIYLSTSGAAWQETKYREEFSDMKSCQARFASWKASLGKNFISGQCYYKAATPLPGDCKAWQQFSFRWTNHCLKKGNDIQRQCIDLNDPPAPYDRCGK
jgi:hypothetical protein